MTRARRIGYGLCALLLAGAGCSFNRGDHPDACRTDQDCDQGESCLAGFCIAPAPVKTGKADGGVDAGTDAAMPPPPADGGQTGEPCIEGSAPEDCYDGDPATQDVGECRHGQRACVMGVFTPCLGQVLPRAEACNSKDDDCDGTEDEIEMGACDTRMRGVCAEGKLVCRDAIAVCEAQNPQTNEQCNELDDDCDGTTDEIPDSECFPDGASGCMEVAGALQCFGLCRPGHLSCDSGEDGCEDAQVAIAEVCTAPGGNPVDEDCDNQVDEMCRCSSGESRECYAGPAGTLGSGRACRPGQQSCGTDGYWGSCEGQVLPAVEDCSNMGADDDCDGTRDDVDQLREPCIDEAKKGICRQGTYECVNDARTPVCVGQAPQTELCDNIDQNCDGNNTDGFDLNSNEHCGTCGNRCERDTSCCNGRCVPTEDFRHDAENCGGCGIPCGTARYCCWNDCLPLPNDGSSIITPGEPTLPPKALCGCDQDCGEKTCCRDQCVDLANDTRNCGGCGIDCSMGIIGRYCCNGRCVANNTLCAIEL